MSVKELKSFSLTSNLNLNDLVVKNAEITTAEISTLDANTVTLNNTTVDTLNVSNNSNLTYITGRQISLTNVYPSLIEYKAAITITALVSTLTATQMKQGILVGNGSAIFKTNIDTAINLFAQLPLQTGQSISFLCVNKSAFQWNFDTGDVANISFNGGLATPFIPAGTQKTLILHYTGVLFAPSYTIYI